MLRIRDFIPDPTFFHPGSRIHTKDFKYFNSKNCFFKLTENFWFILFTYCPDGLEFQKQITNTKRKKIFQKKKSPTKKKNNFMRWDNEILFLTYGVNATGEPLEEANMSLAPEEGVLKVWS